MFDLDLAKELIAKDQEQHTSYSSEHEEYAYMVFACNNFPEAVAEIERLRTELAYSERDHQMQEEDNR